MGSLKLWTCCTRPAYVILSWEHSPFQLSMSSVPRSCPFRPRISLQQGHPPPSSTPTHPPSTDQGAILNLIVFRFSRLWHPDINKLLAAYHLHQQQIRRHGTLKKPNTHTHTHTHSCLQIGSLRADFVQKLLQGESPTARSSLRCHAKMCCHGNPVSRVFIAGITHERKWRLPIQSASLLLLAGAEES